MYANIFSKEGIKLWEAVFRYYMELINHKVSIYCNLKSLPGEEVLSYLLFFQLDILLDADALQRLTFKLFKECHVYFKFGHKNIVLWIHDLI